MTRPRDWAANEEPMDFSAATLDAMGYAAVWGSSLQKRRRAAGCNAEGGWSGAQRNGRHGAWTVDRLRRAQGTHLGLVPTARDPLGPGDPTCSRSASPGIDSPLGRTGPTTRRFRPATRVGDSESGSGRSDRPPKAVRGRPRRPRSRKNTNLTTRGVRAGARRRAKAVVVGRSRPKQWNERRQAGADRRRCWLRPSNENGPKADEEPWEQRLQFPRLRDAPGLAERGCPGEKGHIERTEVLEAMAQGRAEGGAVEITATSHEIAAPSTQAAARSRLTDCGFRQVADSVEHEVTQITPGARAGPLDRAQDRRFLNRERILAADRSAAIGRPRPPPKQVIRPEAVARSPRKRKRPAFRE